MNNKGITIIALIITVVVMLILVTIVVNYGTEEIDKVKLEDIKTTMLLIKGRAQIASEKDEFGEKYDKTGMILYTDEINETTETKYKLPKDLAKLLNSSIQDKSKLYIWNRDALNNNNIDVTITDEDFHKKFYIIDYNTKEVYYSVGYTDGANTYYSLTDMQNL